MKTGILAVAGLCWVVLQPCQAEPPAGWDLLKISTGKEFREVKVTAVEPDGIKITHADGVARVPYEQLPAEVRSAFTFDPESAAKERSKRQTVAQKAMEEAASKKRLEDVTKEAEKTKTVIIGDVVQVLPDGLLLGSLQEYDGFNRRGLSGNAIVKGSFSEVVDDQRVQVSDVYPAGVTQYEDARGSTRTVRLFYADLNLYLKEQKKVR